jgi:hypothetical protein
MTKGKSPAEYILGELLQEWAESFARNNGEYGDLHQELGVRAQYVDMHRKMGKFRRAVWDGVDTSAWREGPREIIMDLIGHCFLTLQLMDSEGSFQQPERAREPGRASVIEADNPILNSLKPVASAPKEWFRDQAQTAAGVTEPIDRSGAGRPARLRDIEMER